jgi:hypothetical protein
VAAPIGFVGVDQVPEVAPGPRLRGTIDLLTEHHDGHRDRDLVGLLRGRTNEISVPFLPVYLADESALFILA